MGAQTGGDAVAILGKLSRRSALVLLGTGLASYTLACAAPNGEPQGGKRPAAGPEPISLPAPALDGDWPFEKALQSRRSRRDYRQSPLRVSEVGQLLWAAQGVTDRASGYRSAPSAGALYPLEVYLAAGDVAGLASGIYRYVPADHALLWLAAGDRRSELCAAAVGQSPVRAAPAVLVFAGVYARTKAKYGERGVRYVQMEAGHAAQNVYLQATCLGLGTVVIGAFDDGQVARILGLPAGEEPLCLLPVGRV